jgi:hypothetical protein
MLCTDITMMNIPQHVVVCSSVFTAHAVASFISGRHFGMFLLCVDLLWCLWSQKSACASPPASAVQNQLQNHTHATHFVFLISVNVYGCKQNSFVAVCTGDFEKPVSCDNSLRDFGGDASNSILVLYNVSAERTCPYSLCCFNKEPIFWNLFLSWYVVAVKGTENSKANFL